MIYSNPKHRNITFERLKFKEVNNIQIPEKFSIKLQTPEEPLDVFVTTIPEKNDFLTRITDSNDKELGACRFCTDGNSFFNLSMNNFSEFKGIGSILHLSRIMTMIENNFKEIKLYSIGDAIPFHAKFKFAANFNNAEEIKDFIFQELFFKQANNSVFGKVIKSAQQWFTNKSNDRDNQLRQGNRILDDFVQTIEQNQLYKDENFNLISGMDMKLERNTVLSQNEFFNNLLRKFGIDYQI